MVEAAIYFPIAVLAAMAALILMIHLYEQGCVQANLHCTLRAAVDEKSGKTEALLTSAAARDQYRATAESIGIEPREDQSGLYKVFTAETETRYFGNRLTSPFGYSFLFAGKSYAIDETFLVRLTEPVKGNQ